MRYTVPWTTLYYNYYYAWFRLDSKVKDKPVQSFKSSIWCINFVDFFHLPAVNIALRVLETFLAFSNIVNFLVGLTP